MDTKEKTLLKSKLKVYQSCFQHAVKQEDHQRMSKLGLAIEELQEKINND
ncbi:MAG: hypothetical protein LKJ21_09575 [Oscillospiraceae bacterium]|jgi:hypothetical protein|nr:hypothetical protein [Oscillospiraceae bacterium]MCI1990748.1 hypothetical protein [Oscillospiraceae bacterium]MCI2035649.1 hypothetical protein [Oscillospiraceae bacterium]